MIRFIFYIWLAVFPVWIGLGSMAQGGPVWVAVLCFVVMVWFVVLALPNKERTKRKQERMVEFHAQRKLARSDFDAEVERRARELLKERG